MAKQQHTIKMYGIMQDCSKAKTHQSKDVASFTNEKGSIFVDLIDDNTVEVRTAKGTYALHKHEVNNLFRGVVGDGIKMHFTKKAVVAKLIYWA